MFPSLVRSNRLFRIYDPAKSRNPIDNSENASHSDDESPTFDSPEMNSQLRSRSYDQNNSDDDEMSNYTPETAANERFNKLLSQFPTREKPGILRRIMAGLSQDSGLAEKIKYAPFYRELEDWKTKVSPFQQAADNETQQNVNKRIMTTTSANLRIRRDDENRKEAADKARFDQTDRKLDIQTRLADIRAKVANGGQIVHENTTGKTYLVKKDGTKIDVDITDIPAADLEELKHDNRVNEIETRGNIADKNADDRSWSNPIQVTNKDGSVGPVIRTNRATGEVQIVNVPDGGIIKPNRPVATATQSETQKIAGQVRRANQLRAKNPEWAQHITINGNKVSITKPSDGTSFFKGSGPDKKTYDQIYKEIFEPTDSSAAVPTPTVPNVNSANPTDGQYIQVKSLRTGKTGRFPANKPLPEGYERIK